MLRFVVNDIAATPDSGGVFSILSDFYQDIYTNDNENDWIFLLAGKYFKEKKNLKIIVRDDLKKSNTKKFIFEMFSGGKFINKLHPDCYISLQNIATLNVKSKRSIVYVHQPLPFSKQNFSFLKKNERKLAFYQKVVGFVIKFSIKKTEPIVIVQTNWMKEEIINEKISRNENVLVAHPVVKFSKTKNLNLEFIRKNFFFPASPFIYKNHEVVVKAANILINKYNCKNFKIIFTINKESLITSEKIPSQIEFLNKIDRKLVFNMYTRSTLIFPSYLETFGLPLLEAKKTGTLILAADTRFAREILKDYENAVFFNKFDAEKLSELMYLIIIGKINISKSPKDNAFLNTNTLRIVINDLFNSRSI